MNILEILQAGIDNSEVDTAIRPYSGRFMYGANCYSVTVPRMNSIANILMNAIANVDEHTDVYGAIAILSAYSVDQLGTGYVVYWPDLHVIETYDEADEESDEY